VEEVRGHAPQRDLTTVGPMHTCHRTPPRALRYSAGKLLLENGLFAKYGLWQARRRRRTVDRLEQLAAQKTDRGSRSHN
jgi:hypothetical protein